jgi:translin
LEKGIDMKLNGIIDKIKEELDRKDKRREEVFPVSREIRRFSTKAIREIHKKDEAKAKELIDKAAGLLSDLGPSDMSFKFMQESLQEYTEAVVVYALLRREDPPGFSELGIPPEYYALGLGDVVGELRKFILDAVRTERYQEVDYFLELMEEISYEIISLDYPSAIVPIRRKQDAARIMLERTRGEVTVALNQARLEKKIDGLDL